MRDLILLVIGFGLGYWYARRKFKGQTRLNFSDEKREDLDKIMALFQRDYSTSPEPGIITNDEVQKLLNVSDATATRYLDKLENEGRILQVGQEGRSVKYKMR